MRALYLKLHVRLGAFAVWILFIWSLTGGLLTLERFVADFRGPNLAAMEKTFDPAAFRLAPSSLIRAKGAEKIELVQRGKLAFYDVRFKDGTREAFDAGNGSPLAFDYDPKTYAEEVKPWAARSGHTVWSIELLERHDEYYSRGDLPVYKIVLLGRGAPYVYVNPRTGRHEKTYSRMARVLHFAEALHRFNFHAWSGFDKTRRIAHALIVALPLFVIACLGLALLWFRRRVY